jgi:hypothetical protein
MQAVSVYFVPSPFAAVLASCRESGLVLDVGRRESRAVVVYANHVVLPTLVFSGAGCKTVLDAARPLVHVALSAVCPTSVTAKPPRSYVEDVLVRGGFVAPLPAPAAAAAAVTAAASVAAAGNVGDGGTGDGGVGVGAAAGAAVGPTPPPHPPCGDVLLPPLPGPSATLGRRCVLRAEDRWSPYESLFEGTGNPSALLPRLCARCALSARLHFPLGTLRVGCCCGYRACRRRRRCCRSGAALSTEVPSGLPAGCGVQHRADRGRL